MNVSQAHHFSKTTQRTNIAPTATSTTIKNSLNGFSILLSSWSSLCCETKRKAIKLNKSLDGSKRVENYEWSVEELAVYVNIRPVIGTEGRLRTRAATVTIGNRQGRASSGLTAISVRRFLARVADRLVTSISYFWVTAKMRSSTSPFRWSPCALSLFLFLVPYLNSAIGLTALQADISTRHLSTAEISQEDHKIDVFARCSQGHWDYWSTDLENSWQ